MKLVAIEPVKAGGKRYEPGTAFEVDDKVGEQLVASGAAEEGRPVKAAKADKADAAADKK